MLRTASLRLPDASQTISEAEAASVGLQDALQSFAEASGCFAKLH